MAKSNFEKNHPCLNIRHKDKHYKATAMPIEIIKRKYANYLNIRHKDKHYQATAMPLDSSLAKAQAKAKKLEKKGMDVIIVNTTSYNGFAAYCRYR